MNKTFTKPFARGNFKLHSTSKESGCAALATALTFNNLDVPDFLLLIYPGEGGEGRKQEKIMFVGSADIFQSHHPARQIR